MNEVSEPHSHRAKAVARRASVFFAACVALIALASTASAAQDPISDYQPTFVPGGYYPYGYYPYATRYYGAISPYPIGYYSYPSYVYGGAIGGYSVGYYPYAFPPPYRASLYPYTYGGLYGYGGSPYYGGWPYLYGGPPYGYAGWGYGYAGWRGGYPYGFGF